MPVAAWTAYLKKGSVLYNTGKDLFSNTYGAQTVDSLPLIPLSTFNTLSDVADSTFWAPYSTN